MGRARRSGRGAAPLALVLAALLGGCAGMGRVEAGDVAAGRVLGVRLGDGCDEARGDLVPGITGDDVQAAIGAGRLAGFTLGATAGPPAGHELCWVTLDGLAEGDVSRVTFFLDRLAGSRTPFRAAAIWVDLAPGCPPGVAEGRPELVGRVLPGAPVAVIRRTDRRGLYAVRGPVEGPSDVGVPRGLLVAAGPFFDGLLRSGRFMGWDLFLDRVDGALSAGHLDEATRLLPLLRAGPREDSLPRVETLARLRAAAAAVPAPPATAPATNRRAP